MHLFSYSVYQLIVMVTGSIMLTRERKTGVSNVAVQVRNVAVYGWCESYVWQWRPISEKCCLQGDRGGMKERVLTSLALLSFVPAEVSTRGGTNVVVNVEVATWGDSHGGSCWRYVDSSECELD